MSMQDSFVKICTTNILIDIVNKWTFMSFYKYLMDIKPNNTKYYKKHSYV